MDSRAIRLKLDARPVDVVAHAYAFKLTATASAVKIVASSRDNVNPDPRYKAVDVATMADVLTSIKFLGTAADSVAMVETISYIGVISKAETVAMAEVVASLGLMDRIDSATLADAVTDVRFLRSQADTLTVADALMSLGLFTCADVMTLGEGLGMLGTMPLVDAAVMAEAWAASFTSAQADSVAMADTMNVAAMYSKADAVTMADSAPTYAYLTGLLNYARPGEFWPGAAMLGSASMDTGGVAPTPPPPPPPPPPPAAQRIALLHFDDIAFSGTPAGSSVINSASGGASNPFKLGGASKGWFDPSGKWTTASPANMVHFENDPSCVVSTNSYTWDGEFGVDFWLGSRGNDTYPLLIDISANGQNTDANRIYLQVERTNQVGSTDTIRFLLFRKPTGGSMTQVLTTSTMTIANNASVMEHIVFQRRSISGTLTIEIAAKGVLLGSIADSNTYTGRIVLGGNYSSGAAIGDCYLGDMDEARVELGAPSFSAMPYTVPTAAYT